MVEALSHKELPFWEGWFEWANSNELEKKIDNNMEVLVLFETDAHCTYASYKFLGVFDDIEKVVKAMEVNYQAHPEHCEQIRHSTTTLTGHGFEFILQKRMLNETF